MRRIVTRRSVAAMAAGMVVLGLAACSTTDDTSSSPSSSGGLTPVTLQLKWFTQAQFAGYYAAVEQGFYKKLGLDVKIKEGAVDIVPQTVLAQGQADFATAWAPAALATREGGADIVDVAQVYQKSGTLQVSFKSKNITSAADLKGKKVGNWGFGNEYELFAGMTKGGLDPSTDVDLVQQQFDMVALLKGDIDAAQAMSYNEYAQVLEAINPDTGKQYTADDFNVINWQDDGTSMLQDGIWTSGEKLKDAKFQDTTVKFIQGSLQGWAYCRDNAEACRDIVVKQGSKLGASHQLWQMDEVNKLIWPAPAGAGMVDQAAWDQTVKIAEGTKNAEGATVLTKPVAGEAFTNTYVEKALANLKTAGVDVTGESFKPQTATLEEGGK